MCHVPNESKAAVQQSLEFFSLLVVSVRFEAPNPIYPKPASHHALHSGIDFCFRSPHGTMEPSPTTSEATLGVATGGSWHRLSGVEFDGGSAGEGL